MRSSLLLRTPGLINNHPEAASWLSALADFKLAKKEHIQKASDLLHFLRGGGSSWDQWISGNTSNATVLEQAYGRIEPRFVTCSFF